MARYGKAVEDKAVARLLSPESISLETVSRELSISVQTLERWLACATSSSPPWVREIAMRGVGREAYAPEA